MHQYGLDDNVSGICSLGFGLLFPAYGSFMAIESSGTEDDTQVRTTTYLHHAVQVRSDVPFFNVAVAGVLVAILVDSRFREVRVACTAMVNFVLCEAPIVLLNLPVSNTCTKFAGSLCTVKSE